MTLPRSLSGREIEAGFWNVVYDSIEPADRQLRDTKMTMANQGVVTHGDYPPLGSRTAVVDVHDSQLYDAGHGPFYYRTIWYNSRDDTFALKTQMYMIEVGSEHDGPYVHYGGIVVRPC